ncbi:MAG: lipid-A-disaccharide synthase N-terminal domain-containing protein [Desulforhopalus sp.]
MNQYLIYTIGFLAQLLFSARQLTQWISSERAGKVLSPLIFWQLSILASFLLMVYGVLREDLAIILGQTITYGVYIRNLHYHGFWKKIPALVRLLALVFPGMAICWLLIGETYNFQNLLSNKEIPLPLMLWGIAGQFVFTFRFVYQWLYSEKRQRSILPMGFWLISIVGSMMVLSYVIVRRDPVLFVGQLFGIVVYSRNMLLWMRRRRPLQDQLQ